MPAKTLILSKSTHKEIAKLPLTVQVRIEKALERLKENPISGIKLHGQLAAYYKLRVGDYRILYRFEALVSQVVVLKIEHRQGVYK